jgi:hypothetical protein
MVNACRLDARVTQSRINRQTGFRLGRRVLESQGEHSVAERS